MTLDHEENTTRNTQILSVNRKKGRSEIAPVNHARATGGDAGISKNKKADPTQEELKRVLKYDCKTGVFTWRVNGGKAIKGNVAGSPGRGYIHIGVGGKRYRAHRLAWIYVHGRPPAGDIDHKNGCCSDNRLCNLRVCQPGCKKHNQQNQRRPHKGNKSGFLGVSFSRETNNWRAFIHYDGKLRNLGGFSTPEKAHQKYLEAKRNHHFFCTI
jgi:hypothetical protein